MARPIVLLPDPIAPSGMRLLEEHCQVVMSADGSGEFDDATLARAEAVLLRLSKADRAFMERTP